MNEKHKGYIKSIVMIAIGIFVICYLREKPQTYKEYLSYAGYAVTGTTLIAIIYVNWGWRWNKFEKLPRLCKEYSGIIEYFYNGIEGKKQAKISVKQTLFSTRIRTTTDENSSTSISSEIVVENDCYVLYYTYITNPKSKVSDTNPIQYGTCRLEIDNINTLRGKYWTSSKTSGDMYWKGGELVVNEYKGIGA